MTGNSRVALVTGATSGIGLAIAQRLTQAGYWVALHSRASSVAGLQEAAAMENTKYFQADLLDEGARKESITLPVAIENWMAVSSLLLPFAPQDTTAPRRL